MGAAVLRVLPRAPGRRAAAAGTAVLVLVAVGVLAVVLSRDGGAVRSAPSPITRPATGMLGGLPLQRANCTSWHGASAADRAQAVRALSATIGGASTSGGFGTTLSDGDVAALFDRVCSTPGTSSFVLYLIYARAAAFSHQGHGPTPITAPPAQPPV